uniref:Uncharacterized protein n=1 Tax=Glossina pallidipes TaxID=7398 RepID=A0A1A9ZBL5_GLOPL
MAVVDCYWKQISSKKHMDKTRGLLFSSRVEKGTIYGRSHNVGLMRPSISAHGCPTPRPTRTSEDNALQPIDTLPRLTARSIARFEDSTPPPRGTFEGTTPRSTLVTFEDNTQRPIGMFGGTAPRVTFQRFMPRPIGKFGRPVPRPHGAFASSVPHSTDTFGNPTSRPTRTFGGPTPSPTGAFESRTLRPTGTSRSAATRSTKKSEGPTPSVSNDHRHSTSTPLLHKSNAPPTNKVRFDEEQIRQHLLFKHYSYLGIPKAKTPIPRPAEPVEFGELRDRLVAILDGSSRKPAQVRYIDDIEEMKDLREERTLEFLEKRKAFYFQEFTIARQKCTNSSVLSLPPGPSIGNDWTTGQQSLSSMRRISCTRTSTVTAADKASSISTIDPRDLRYVVDVNRGEMPPFWHT